MRGVSALTSSRTFLAVVALTVGVALGATAVSPAGRLGTSGSTSVAAVAPVAVVDQAVGRPLAARAGAAGIGLRRLLIGKTERAEITIATDAGTKTILYTKGEITAISASSITISLSDNRHETFAIDASTILREKGKAITAADLGSGERAMVFGLRNADGSYTAKLIRCVTGKANPATPNQTAPNPSGS